MRETGLDLTMHCGESLAFDIAIAGEVDGSVTSVAMRATGKLTGTALFSLALNSGIAAITGGWRVTVPTSATSGATPGSYDYVVEIQITKSSVVKSYMPLYGTLNLLPRLATS